MSKSHKPFKWEGLLESRNSVATTLLVNIKAIKGLLDTEAFCTLKDNNVYKEAETAFTTMTTEYTDRLQGIFSMHADKHGVVDMGETHSYLHFAQQYHNLGVDIASTAVAFGKILINLNRTLQGASNDTTH